MTISAWCRVGMIFITSQGEGPVPSRGNLAVRQPHSSLLSDVNTLEVQPHSSSCSVAESWDPGIQDPTFS